MKTIKFRIIRDHKLDCYFLQKRKLFIWSYVTELQGGGGYTWQDKKSFATKEACLNNLKVSVKYKLNLVRFVEYPTLIIH